MKQFGEFVLDTKQTRLLRQDQEVAIEPKLFELLSLFVEQPNSIISRQDILDALWPGSLVTDNAINKMIANLRKVLGDGAKNPRYIQTVPKRGYRLISEVLPIAPYSVTDITKQISSETRKDYGNPKILSSEYNRKVIFIFLSILLCVLLWQFFHDKDHESSTHYYTKALTRSHGAEQSARMHPDRKHLYYLKKDAKHARFQLWLKNIHTEQTEQIDIGSVSMSQIIALDTQEDGKTTNLFYLDKKQSSCGVYRATLSSVNQIKHTVEKLFDCSNKRIKDIDYHAEQQVIYYAAQPKNLWPNQIYAFELKSQKHSLATQTEPAGWGHHSIDISPDGEKLLIMSTNSDYKTQLLVLDLLTNEITEGVKFNRPVYEAIWHHDSKKIYYYASPPAHQIIKSDLDGDNATTVVNVSEYLAPRMTLFPDGQNLLFSTKQENFSNRWLVPPEQVEKIDNSTVNDSNPALFHHSPQYLFVSERSGRRQLYLAHYDNNQAKIVTNFALPYWLGYIAVSTDDQSVLLNVENKIYHLPISELSIVNPLTLLKQEHLIYSSESPIISLDWLSKSKAAITTVVDGSPELVVVSLNNKKIQPINGQWAYGLTDSKQPDGIYLIEQQTNALYRAKLAELTSYSAVNQNQAIPLHLNLADGFYHVKIDSNTLYYGSDENGNTYLNVVPLNDTKKSKKYLLDELSSYDVNNGQIMVSDIESLEGDVHRTIH